MGCVMSSETAESTRFKQGQIQRMRKQLQQKNQQITILQKQNDELKNKRKQKLQQVTNEIREQEIQLIEFEQDGQADDINHGQLGVATLLKCTICEQEYNMIDRIPWMVCSNQHTYCSQCIGGMLRRNQTNCPQCRQNITSGNRNAHICLLIQNTMGKKESEKKLSSPPVQLMISVNRSNRYYSQYNFAQNGNMIVKAGDHNWYGLLCNEVLPAEGTFKFCIQIVFSLHNNVQVGIIDVASKVQKGKMSNKRVTYHLFDGRIMDSGHIDKPMTAWNPKGRKTDKGTNAKVIVVCDMDRNRIEWHVNGQLKGQAIISNFLKYSKAVPYISMYHSEDVVMLNAW